VSDHRPVLFVTGHAPPDRVGAFRALHEREGVVFALFGGRLQHGTAEQGDLDLPHLRVTQRDVMGLAASGHYRAVVCGTGGRLALPAAWAGARRARVPFVLWASLWAHPRTAAHVAGYALMRSIYARADAVVTYGPHVSRYVRARGARNVHVAPQAVDNAFWSAPLPSPPPRPAEFTVVFAGRAVREKGSSVLMQAWRASGLRAPEAALVFVGGELAPPRVPVDGAVHFVGQRPPEEVRNFYALADVVVVPSIATRTFREPWGLVINEAMNRSVPVISSDAVGAAAGGLVRHERNGLIFAAGDADALVGSIRRLHGDSDLRRRLGDAGARDVAAYTYGAWAQGFSAALGNVGASARG
jgi:glycosyltransferase involved in cell wall biosynthesis